MIKRNYICIAIFIISIGTVSFDLHSLNKNNDISMKLDLESDDNGNNHNQAIPELGGQMPESQSAFDSFDQEDTINSLFNEAQDDLDASISSSFKNLRQDSQLMLAVLKNDIINVESLLKNKKNNVNYRNKDGQTALHYAALYNYDKLAEILLDNNTDINSADNLGRTPLHLAAQNDSCQAAASLILHGAHAALKDNDDKIALDYAKSSEMKNIVAI